MNTLDQLLDAVHNSTLTRDEEALLRCQVAYELEQAGDYEAAREQLLPFWPRFGEHPTTRGLTDRAAAELLLRTGSLTGWLGSSRQLVGMQENAKDLLGEGCTLFESVGFTSKVYETQIETAWCYWREGNLDETIAIIESAIDQNKNIDSDLKALAFFRMACAESDSGLHDKALGTLLEVEPLIEASSNHSLKGRYYISLAVAFRNSASFAEQPDEYFDRALIYYAAAAYHIEEAQHFRNLALIENNLGYLLYKIGHFDEAESHINRGRSLSIQLNDDLLKAVVEDSLAQLLISKGNVQKAEQVINSAISTLEKGDNKDRLLDSLITQSMIFVRLGKADDLRGNLCKILNLADLDFVIQQISKIAITPNDDAQLRCGLAKEFEDRGEYNQARKVMGHLWQRVGERPKLDGLDNSSTAEVLLRAGVLTGHLGSARQISGAQELAKDLITESRTLFEKLLMSQKVFETQLEITVSYIRQGAFNEADILLSDLTTDLTKIPTKLIVIAAIRKAFVKWKLSKHEDSIKILIDVERLLMISTDDVLKGRYYTNLALAYRGAAQFHNSPSEYLDRALIHYTAAAFHLEKVQNKKHLAIVENNIGFLFLVMGRYDAAEEHLNRSSNLYAQIKDSTEFAFVDDSRARVFLAQNRLDEAKSVIKAAIISLRKSDNDSFLAEALVTQAIIQSRLGDYINSTKSFEEAITVADRIGVSNVVVCALISMLEELKDFLSTEGLVTIYKRADQLLATSQAKVEVERLRKCAKFVVAAATEDKLDERRDERVAESFERRLIPTSSPVLSGAQQCAQTEEAVLITGEYELGKKTLAHAMHKWSGRGGRFVSLSCAMLGERPSMTLTKSFARAEAGTVLLENVEELDARAQGMIQRLVETGELHSTFTETTASRPKPRVIATTSRNLFEEVARGRFSASLYYSLSTLEVDLSSFAEPHLSEH